MALPDVVWRLLWALYFVLALLLLAVRFVALPQVAHERGRIEAMLSRQMGLEVHVGAIKAEWNGLRPSLELLDLKVMDAGKRQALELPRVDAVLGWSSLWQMRPVLYRLEVQRPQLEIRREADGSIHVAGIKIGGGSTDSGFSDFVLSQEQILIHDAQLVWTDVQRNAPPLALDHLNLRLDNDHDRHRFALTANPPKQWSEMIDVRGDLRGQQLTSPEAWRGTVYLAVEQADLAAWKRWVDYPVALDRGRASLRAWLNVEGPKVFGLTADVVLAGLNAQLGDDLAALSISSLSGRVRASLRDDDLSVAGERLTLMTGEGGRVEPTSFSLISRAANDREPAVIELATGRLDLGLVAKLAGRLPLPASIKDRLQQLQPHGRLDAFKLTWKSIPDAPPQFTVDARFAQLGLESSGHFPGVQNLSGQLTGDEREGRFHLNVRNGSLSLPAVMPESIRLDQAGIDGGWKHERIIGQDDEALTIELSSLRISNPDAQGEFSGFWRSAASGPGYLDLRGTAQRARASAAVHYMPLITPPEVTQWIGQGLRAGYVDNVKLQVTGDLRDFPYRKGGGVFRISGRIADAEVMFADGWLGLSGVRGSLLFDGARMLITAQTGRYMSVQTPEVKVEIPDLMDMGQQVLLVDGKARGPTSDFLHYVYASNLAELAGDFTRSIVARGSGELGLHIEVPLHHANETRVRGEYVFAANQVKLVPQLPELGNASGTLTFTEKGIGLRAAEADFMGRRVSASGLTETDGSLRFEADGSVSIEGLRQIVRVPVWDYLRGEAQAHATIRVKGKTVDVAVNSLLSGLSSNFPVPLRKAAATEWPLVFGWRSEVMQDGHSVDHWQVQVDKRLNVDWEDVCAPHCVFSRGLLRYEAQAELPLRGWRLAGRFDHLDADPWRPVVQHLASSDSTDAKPDQETLAGLAFKATDLVVGGHRFNDVSAKAVRQEGNWTLKIEGPQAEGDLVWTEAGRGKLLARLKHLTLVPVPPQTASDDAMPVAVDVKVSELPALDVVAEKFYLRKLDLGRLQLSAINSERVWLLQKITLTSPDFELEGTGRWLAASGAVVGPTTQTRTYLDFQLASDNAGAMLERFGYANTVREGKVKLTGGLDWQGPPTSIDYPSLTGKMQMDASAGRFNKLEPGAGRLLGLLSLQFLPRRLTLDFRDLFSEGFAFDSIKGSMEVTSGVMRTQDLEIVGAAAQVSMRGTTDLGLETHALHLMVQPTLSETVAVGVVVGQAAVGIMNPLIGVAAYLAQKILRDPVEKIFSYEYEISGPWADPKIEKVGSAATALPAKMRSGSEPLPDSTKGGNP